MAGNQVPWDPFGGPRPSRSSIRVTAMTRRTTAFQHRLGSATAAMLLLALVAAPVLALDEPPRLEDPVTDQADVLTAAEEAEVVGALEQLRNDADVQLFTAYVDTTGGEDVNSFTEATAAASSLGGNDALILVAIEHRSYSMWVDPSLDEITADQLDATLTDLCQVLLCSNEFVYVD